MDAKLILLIAAFLFVAGPDTVSARKKLKKLKNDLEALQELVETEQSGTDKRILALEKFQQDLLDNYLLEWDKWKFGIRNAALDVNLALGQKTSASSYMDDKDGSPAVDGNLSGSWGDGSCTHTNSEDNPWWIVNFGESLFVGRVVIKNRQDCCGERLHNFNIDVRETESSDWKTVATYPGKGKDDELITITFDTVRAHDLRIQIMATGSVLTLCEVQVYVS